MNELRIILLIAGVAAIAALWLWESRRERRAQRGHTLLDRTGPAPGMPLRGPGPAPAAADIAQALADLGRSMGKAASAPPPPAAGAEGIVALHVVARHAAFRGPDIDAAATAAGLRHGPMRIYHRYDADDLEYEEPLYSMASMREPGYIDRQQLDAFSTTGLSLFMCRPVAGGDRAAFEAMLQTAEQLARTLDGEVHGPDHLPLDAAGLAGLRARLAD